MNYPSLIITYCLYVLGYCTTPYKSIKSFHIRDEIKKKEKWENKSYLSLLIQSGARELTHYQEYLLLLQKTRVQFPEHFGSSQSPINPVIRYEQSLLISMGTMHRYNTYTHIKAKKSNSENNRKWKRKENLPGKYFVIWQWFQTCCAKRPFINIILYLPKPCQG